MSSVVMISFLELVHIMSYTETVPTLDRRMQLVTIIIFPVLLQLFLLMVFILNQVIIQCHGLDE